jgi:hypothetical protein
MRMVRRVPKMERCLARKSARGGDAERVPRMGRHGREGGAFMRRIAVLWVSMKAANGGGAGWQWRIETGMRQPGAGGPRRCVVGHVRLPQPWNIPGAHRGVSEPGRSCEAMPSREPPSPGAGHCQARWRSPPGETALRERRATACPPPPIANHGASWGAPPLCCLRNSAATRRARRS